jgi:proteasome lid subunit RPN8/RPN11
MFIDPDALRAIIARARRDRGKETCGLLVGKGEHILEAVETVNTADDPTRHYEIRPEDYFAQIRRCRSVSERLGGTPSRRSGRPGEHYGVLGAYHSHPNGAPDPSPTDLAQAFEDFIYVIAGPAAGGGGMEVRAYRLVDGNFQAVPLVPVAEEESP